jgi:flavin-dependent dehydrogenase
VADVLRPRDLGARVVTLEELRRVLLPLCMGWVWAEDAIVDLWKTGAPTPDSGPGRPERRILRPAQFLSWLGEVAERTGVHLHAGEVLKHVDPGSPRRGFTGGW